ncbi:MAG: leucine--tRNA ligase [Planctomycetaceae bacterium]|nr:leucine--tRNA ligase [Planctomycetaceae bacterium]
MPRYNPAEIEPKWQQFWEQHQCFKTPEVPAGKKKYVLDMFPYPSGKGLHVGHPEGYTATDILARYWRANGYSVLHPMGFDAFGLPAEEYAIQTNTPPRQSTERDIANFTRQLKMLGFSYDWDRCLATTDVEYFKWTQWIFLLLFDTWFDAERQVGRPISELPIPAEVAQLGEVAVAKYRDEHRLAYQSEELVNWCAGLGTVLANEEVINGRSERGNHPVTRIPLRQWMLRITAYADRLARDLDVVDWAEGIKNQQRMWIGRSVGAEVDFFVGQPSDLAAWQRERAGTGWLQKPDDRCLRVFTTRPDTLFGATYMVVAPEHPLVDRLTIAAQANAVAEYRQMAASKSDRDRQDDKKTKTGVFTGSYAINPATQQPIPVWVADYVLIGYGTGAIMAVPAHDERDFEFAAQFDLPVVAVLEPSEALTEEQREAVRNGTACYTGPGSSINSDYLNGLATEDAKRTITERLSAQGVGRESVNYKLRDWLFSRQRFWGEPFPILHELDAQGQPTGVVVPLDPSELPLDLPPLEDYKPHGRPEPPLGKAPAEWLYVERNGRRYKRETNTMPQWAGSCWYYLRYIDNKNPAQAWDRVKEAAWMPVDLYVGGAEHAVLHLLYARFWHKVLFDRGYVSTTEPFQKLVNQGMILGEATYYCTPADYALHRATVEALGIQGVPVLDDENQISEISLQKLVQGEVVALSESDTLKQKGQVFLVGTELPLRSRSDKMSKSRGNVITPDSIVEQFGADSLRLYEMFMGPLTATKPWNMAGVVGVRNFLDRAWRMIVDDRTENLALAASVGDYTPTESQQRVLHKTIKAVTEDIEDMGFNTAISRMMEFVNAFTKDAQRPRTMLQPLVIMLAPFAPHIAEELWQVLGGTDSVSFQKWPEYDPQWVVDDVIEVPVQIQGKLRGKIFVSPDASAADMLVAAKADDKIAPLLAGVQIVKEIVVPGRLVNFVIKP